MAGNTKELRLRIKSVNSTLQLTKAMELVASSKIRRANETMLKGREYRKALEGIIAPLTSNKESLKSPYMRQSDGGKMRLIVIAGDRGLAGGYNSNVFKLCSAYPDAEIIAIGRRACDRFKKPFISSEHFSFADASALAKQLCEDFKEEKFDKLGVIYTQYISVMSSKAEFYQLLPFERAEKNSNVGTVFEPDELTVLNNTAIEYVAGVLTTLVRESFACEVSARRIAMNSAGKNAEQMIDDLSLQYNRARQSAITGEITEIVAGSGN